MHNHNVAWPNLFAHRLLKIVIKEIPKRQKRNINTVFDHFVLLKHRSFGNGIADVQYPFSCDFDDEAEIFNRPAAPVMDIEQLHAQTSMLAVETFALFRQHRHHPRFHGFKLAGRLQLVRRLIRGKEKCLRVVFEMSEDSLGVEMIGVKMRGEGNIHTVKRAARLFQQRTRRRRKHGVTCNALTKQRVNQYFLAAARNHETFVGEIGDFEYACRCLCLCDWWLRHRTCRSDWRRGPTANRPNE